MRICWGASLIHEADRLTALLPSNQPLHLRADVPREFSYGFTSCGRTVPWVAGEIQDAVTCKVCRRKQSSKGE